MPTFSRHERLKSRKAIGALFKGGQAYVAYPLRIVWAEVGHDILETDVQAQITFVVPKRHFKTAVQRNRLKRQIREAYRLRKEVFYEKLAASGLRISVLVSYIAKEPLPFAEISAGVEKMIRKFPGGKQA